jgi:hypothetical protein
MHLIRTMLVAAACIATSAYGDSTKTGAGAVDAQSQRYEAKEHYRFNLGGDSGFYTDWERLDLDGFDGLTTTIKIEKAYGQPSDKWASLARINLYGPGLGKDRALLSLVVEVDRKDNHADPSIYRSKDKPREGFNIKLPVGKAFDVTIVRNAPGKLLVSFDKATFEVPCDFDVRAISAAGSGIDVRFEPFNLLKRVTL